jgi:hypothetical protein
MTRRRRRRALRHIRHRPSNLRHEEEAAEWAGLGRPRPHQARRRLPLAGAGSDMRVMQSGEQKMSFRNTLRTTLFAGAICALAVLVAGATPAIAQPGPGGGRGGDNAGFESIFDGKTLNNWDGDPMFWRAENGEIVAQSTPEKVVKVNTFLIWKGGTVKDFEFKAEFKLTQTANSGIQYRSAIMPDRGQWAMRGPQADMDGQDTFTGMYYEENMRKAPGGASKLIASLGTAAELKAFLKPNDWNSIHIIAKGSTMIHIVNGHVMSIFVDDQTDYPQRLTEGLLGLQMHVGQPMTIQFRNILLKKM